jgi:hypothetical protein
MSKHSFVKDEETTAVEEYVENGQGLIKSDRWSQNEGGHGDHDTRDIEIPYITIAQGQSKLLKQDKLRRFHAGDLVLMKEYVIPAPMRCTIFGWDKYFCQNLDIESNEIPIRFNTKDEVLKSGGNLNEFVKPGEDPDNFMPQAEIRIAVELPEDLAMVVPGVLPYEGRFICRVKWTTKGRNYTSLIGRLNLVAGPLRLEKPPRSIAYKYGDITVEEKGKKNPSFVADFAPKGNNTPEFVEFLRSIF